MKNKKLILTTILTCTIFFLTATTKNPLVGTLLKGAINVATTAKKVHDQQRKFKTQEKEPVKVSPGILSLTNKSKKDSSSTTMNNFEEGNLTKEMNRQTGTVQNLTDDLYSFSDNDTLTVSSYTSTKDNPVFDVQQTQTYSGEYPNRFQRVYMLNLTATYDYYENEDMSRVYHGPFCLKFDAQSAYKPGGPKGPKRIGSIKGQFCNGSFSGDWTFVYPYACVDFEKKGYQTSPYTATLRCSFEEGELNGPLEVVVTNGTNKIVAKTTIRFKNGKRDGEITHFRDMAYIRLENLQGQYVDDKRNGKWTYSISGNKGIATYNEYGVETSNYIINSQTGEKKYGNEIQIYDLDYGDGISVAVLLHVVADICVDESKRFHTIWNY